MITTEVVLVTPEVARQFLKNNTCNRPLKVKHAQTISADMKAGRWREDTGENLKFAKGGGLLDGQHRLHGVLLSGRSFRFEVKRGLDPVIMDVLDTGKKRSASDVLTLKGAKNPGLVAAIIRSVLTNSIVEYSGISNRMVEEEYEKDMIMWDNVSTRAQGWYKQFKPLSGGFFGFCFATVLRNTHSSSKAIAFFEALAGGVGPKLIVDLRNDFVNDRASKGRKLTIVTKTNMVRHTWNAHIKSRKSRDTKTEGWL